MQTLADVLAEHGYTADLKIGAKPYRPEEPMVYLADVTKLVETIGWKPSTSLREGLSKMVDAYFE